jgi:hypothetical protein
MEARQSATWWNCCVTGMVRLLELKVTRLYLQHPRRFLLELLESLTLGGDEVLLLLSLPSLQALCNIIGGPAVGLTDTTGGPNHTYQRC